MELEAEAEEHQSTLSDLGLRPKVFERAKMSSSLLATPQPVSRRVSSPSLLPDDYLKQMKTIQNHGPPLSPLYLRLRLEFGADFTDRRVIDLKWHALLGICRTIR